MARTLSDTIIIAMIEAATRMASGRGPISGGVETAAPTSGTSGESTATAMPAGAEGQQPAATPATPEGTGATPASGGSGSVMAVTGEAAGGAGGTVHDPRTAQQIAADFKTIYEQIEELVKASAEQETKSVGFAVR